MTLTAGDVLARPDYRFPITAERIDAAWGVRVGDELMSLDDVGAFLGALRSAIGQARHLSRHPRADQDLLEAKGQSAVDAAREGHVWPVAATRGCMDRHPAGKGRVR